MKHLGRAIARLWHSPFAIVLTALVLCWPLSDHTKADEGGLDVTFGVAGKATTDFGTVVAEAHSIAIQSDGRIVAAGRIHNGNPTADFALARYKTNGILDTSFGNAGKVITDFFGNNDQVSAVVIQSDGRIIAAGFAENSEFHRGFAMARYNNDGSLDTTFGSNGKTSTYFPFMSGEIHSIALQSNGKIVAAGETDDFALIRYNIDGSVDTSFGVLGKVTTAFFSGSDIAQDVAILSDGKIVAVGFAQQGVSGDFALAQYNPDGSLDTSFGIAGKTTTDFQGRGDGANALAIQNDGKIVAVGAVMDTSSFAVNFGLARYNRNGTLDTDFGSGGKVITVSTIGGYAFATDVAIQTDGKILAAGSAVGSSTGEDFALYRYNPNGSIDNTFGIGGKVTTDFFGISDNALAMAIQNDGNVVLAGTALHVSRSEFALARYNSNSAGSEICLQDDSNGNLFKFDSTTGDYQFTQCVSGLTIGGTGSLTNKANIITLQHYATDRRVLARLDGAIGKGTASIQIFSLGTTFTITDRNTVNNTCACP